MSEDDAAGEDGRCGVCGLRFERHDESAVLRCLRDAVSRSQHDRELRLAGTRRVVELLNEGLVPNSPRDYAIAKLMRGWPELYDALCDLRVDEAPSLRARLRAAEPPSDNAVDH